MLSRKVASQLKELETPFYLYDINLLRQTLESVVYESNKYNYKVHYAIKANNDDYLLSIIKEYGIGIAMILVALYVWIFFRAIEIFERCPKKFPAMLSLGVALLITGQALQHIMVTVNIIPETGQTLPLISRGGSSLIFTCIALGMILSVSRQNDEQSHDKPRGESLLEKK